jgi:hypothetical protein
LTPDIPFEFPVILLLIPVIREFFPVNFRREFNEKSLQRSGFPLGKRVQKPRNEEIPC